MNCRAYNSHIRSLYIVMGGHDNLMNMKLSQCELLEALSATYKITAVGLTNHRLNSN